MKEKIIIFSFLLLHIVAFSQSHEIGVIAGGTNYIGDIGDTQYVAPNDIALGVVYRLNRSKRHTYRFSYTHYNIKANDVDSDVINRSLRGKEFTNGIDEFAVGMEFSFWDFDLHNSEPQSTPYLHSGISVINYKEMYFIGNSLKENGTKTNFSIPITLGYKMRLLEHIILSAEVSAKYTFTDNLDGSNPDNNGGVQSFGNIYNNDWYVFSGIMLTYTFGRTPCFCNF